MKKASPKELILSSRNRGKILVNFGEDADCERAIFSRPFLPHIFSNSKSSAALLAFRPRHLCFMLAINPDSLERAGNDEEHGGLRRIRIMEKKFCYRMYYTAIFTI